MATLVTPRIQRAFDYASQEAFAAFPESVPCLDNDYRAMLAQDVPEADIIEALLTVPLTILKAERKAALAKALCAALGIKWEKKGA